MRMQTILATQDMGTSKTHVERQPSKLSLHACTGRSLPLDTPRPRHTETTNLYVQGPPGDANA